MKSVLVFAIATVVTLAASFSASAVGADDAGRVKVVTESGSTDQRTSGFGQTMFSLKPPDGAACQGDSANDQYRVQSFIVPVTTDPGTIRYKSIGPASSTGYALYDIYTRPYVQAQTLPNLTAGHPGRVHELPTFNFAVYPPGYLPPGRYHVGIACTLHLETTRFWDTDLDLVTAPSDKPAMIHWSLADGSRIRTRTSPVRWIVALGLVGMALVVIVLRRRAPNAAPTPRENA